MKNIKYMFLAIIPLMHLGCEESIEVETDDVASSIVINAFIDNRPINQVVTVTFSRNFDDSSPYEGVSADEVYIEDLTDSALEDYVFSETSSGTYEWIPPTAMHSFGIIGHEYQLNVVVEGQTFTSNSTLHPVPNVDSIRFNYAERSIGLDERYLGEFFATDLPGLGNTYWIKAYKNGIFLDQPEYILTSFDGTFSETDEDGELFLPPIRNGINPLEEDNVGYDIGDVVRVELLSITQETYNYLNEIRTQTSRPGGISELFSVPITNLTGNVFDQSGDRVLGFFCTSSVSYDEQELTEVLAEEARNTAD